MVAYLNYEDRSALRVHQQACGGLALAYAAESAPGPYKCAFHELGIAAAPFFQPILFPPYK